MTQWYVRADGDPVGPLSTDLVVRGIQAGRVPAHAAVMDSADGAWRPIATVPAFAAALQGGAPAPQAQPPAVAAPAPVPSSVPRWQPVVGVVGSLFLTLVACGLLSKSRSPITARTEPTTPPPVVSTARPEPPREPTLAEKLRDTKRLPDAMELILPGVQDTQDKPDTASSILALWMSNNPSWSAIEQLPETTHARILKDSQAERGKRLCVSGQVVQIAREQGTKLFYGTLFGEAGRMTYYYAVGSTGDIVDGHRARFCGVSAGRFSYENTGGGTTHAVRLVGMFDLPENRKL
jgi:hypothetical protein